jgi:hypothetical protein
MQTLRQTHSEEASLNRLACLLTGERETSVDAPLETAGTETGPSPFAEWMAAWSRRVAIAKVLTAIRGELAASARRIASMRVGNSAPPSGSANVGELATSLQFERALQPIDIFPRCALVLTTFGGISIEDAAVLLDATEDLVRQARTVGFRELFANLARMKSRTPVARQPFLLTTEVQHA